ncbi:molybdate ABC transporter substrate-binding protein [Halorhodospira halophila]|uniref:Molybdenum ABC transporter, periplasmic molybdate-binding protein n=1 Tax=Halorhodospira halophila (strain DSM 244 / SL1) TaxID=349124 RepID=A1WTG6_HALHL|nr:molybdate ABC transporter substrate-binding protein [Halorhodospira halophila]ABM60978.1 molybdenum ABC transporter, periplasmic molybdate-binding protein [Halorhodospira halophila SL1]MBK1728636.1 molybdate ABC transporter substrate-binding protein [Halorhodospira halophila]
MPLPVHRHGANPRKRPSALALLGFAVAWLFAGSAIADATRIAVASGLRHAMNDLVAQFQEQYPEHRLAVSYGSSGSLRTQIANGAPFSAFFAADMARPEALVDSGHAGSAVRHYASGQLVLWTRNQGDATELADLKDPSFRRIAIAHPEHAPYGARAVEALQAEGVYEAVADRLVTGNTVTRALQQAQSGAAQAALIPLSLAIHPNIAEQGQYTPIDPELHHPLEHGYIITRRGAEDEAVARFMEFVGSTAGRETLREHGFHPPE